MRLKTRGRISCWPRPPNWVRVTGSSSSCWLTLDNHSELYYNVAFTLVVRYKLYLGGAIYT